MVEKWHVVPRPQEPPGPPEPSGTPETISNLREPAGLPIISWDPKHLPGTTEIPWEVMREKDFSEIILNLEFTILQL